MKSHRKRNFIIAFLAVGLLLLSWGVVQYRQMSNLTFRFFYPEGSSPSEKFANIYPLKDSLFVRSATEFSEYLNQLEFVPCDDEFYQKVDVDDNSHRIDIRVDDGSKDLVKNYFVFERPKQYVVFDKFDETPAQYAIVEGTQYDYLHQKLLEGREKLGITSSMNQS